MSSLVKAKLDYKRHGLYIMTTPKEEGEEMLKRFILNLLHVKELEIGIVSYKVLSRLEAKGFIFPSNLKVPEYVTSHLYSDGDLLELDDYPENDSSENDSSENGSSDSDSSHNDSSHNDSSGSDSVESIDSEELMPDNDSEDDERPQWDLSHHPHHHQNKKTTTCWKNLIRLDISYGYLDEDSIENILSGCPLLETLKFRKCYGYSRLNITSKSVKNLVFFGYMDPPPNDRFADIIAINAPNILSLTIRGDLLLWMLLLQDVSSLVNVDLNYTKHGHSETTHKEAEDEMLKAFILSLSHVKELKIGISCFKAFFHLEASGFKFPSNLKVLGSLEVADWSNCSDSDSAESGDWKVKRLID